MKTVIIALSAAVLIAAAPAVLAQNVSSKTPDQQHHASKKHPRLVSGYAPSHTMHAKGLKAGYPGAFGYAPSEPKDWALEGSRQAGGGGGGGSGM
jgi:opacity protein-like surface antigen